MKIENYFAFLAAILSWSCGVHIQELHHIVKEYFMTEEELFSILPLVNEFLPSLLLNSIEQLQYKYEI
jgi:hypothetical protein